jgi:RNA polymerase sigma-70 factor (ECF subfamily)
MRAADEDWLALLERLEKGDRVALVRLSSLVTGYLARFHAYEHRDSWDDVCQEVLIKLVRAARQGAIRDPRAFVSYVGTVTRSTLIDWLRKNARLGIADAARNPEQAERELERLEADVGSHKSPDLLVDLDRAVSELPEAERRTVDAIYLEGRSYEEAAERLGMPLGTLKRHQTQGLRALRERMGLGGGAT